MVGSLLCVWRSGSRCLRHLHPCTRVVGVDLERPCGDSTELGVLRLHRLFEAVDVGDGWRDAEGDGLGWRGGVFLGRQELNPECVCDGCWLWSMSQ